jgi:CRISPR-associated protein Cmr2
MSYDLYVDAPKGDSATQLRLLVALERQGAAKGPLPRYLKLIHGQAQKGRRQPDGEFNPFIEEQLKGIMTKLGLIPPTPPDLARLPTGSWFLQFGFTLAKPYMSRDDDPFYVVESINPVRKDKVFKVPMTAASSWKGLLRWTGVHEHLVVKGDGLDREAFARDRLKLRLLFGDEIGAGPEGTEGLSAFLDELHQEAVPFYRRALRQHFRLPAEDQQMPRHSGRLLCYPTFYDRIDVEAINPHSRETKAGTQPIYLECAPTGAKGTFSLLYVPFDLLGKKSGDEIRSQAKADLEIMAEVVSAMMLKYGFSAKRSSGFGEAEDKLTEGLVRTVAGEKQITTLSGLPQEVTSVEF